MRWGAAMLAACAACACAPRAATPWRPTPQTPVSELLERTQDDVWRSPRRCFADVEQWLVWHPGDAALFERRAVCFVVDRGREAKARAPAEAAVAADPTRAVAQLIIADLTKVGNPRRAVVAYRAYLAHRAPARAGSDASARAELGLALLRLGRVDEAIAELERARRAVANVTAARGLCLAYALRDDVRGLLLCEQLVAKGRAAPGDDTVPYALARLFLIAGDPARARHAAAVFATTRGERLEPAVLDDPAVLSTWLRNVRPPIPR